MYDAHASYFFASLLAWTMMIRFQLFVAGICLALLVGCGGPAGISAEGQRFVLADEPAGAQGILDYRESKLEAVEVSLIGRVRL